MLTKLQLHKIATWMQSKARPLDLAKWNYIFDNGSKADIVEELVKFQNSDGGFGNGLEPDVIMPDSNAVSGGEAIFIAYRYELDCSAPWFAKLLDYFEHTIQSTPSFWEFAPKEMDNYPRAPWWNYTPDKKFTPNPCAVIASAMILHGSGKQKEIGLKIAHKCFDFLLSDEFCGDHECYNLMALIDKIKSVKMPLITDEMLESMKRRISANVCYDHSMWSEYHAQPINFADSPNSPWYECVKDGMERNLNYMLDNINHDGIWQPNFSWGIDSDIAKEVTKQWMGYIAVNNARIIKNFNLIEN